MTLHQYDTILSFNIFRILMLKYTTTNLKKLETLFKELNYKVDKNASNLRTQQSNTLALLYLKTQQKMTLK